MAGSQPVAAHRARAAGASAVGPPLIELRHASVALGGRKVLDQVSFTLRHGERWALVGANGAGKTLFLKLLRGDVWPTPDRRQAIRYLDERTLHSQPPPPGERLAYVGPERQDRYERYGWNFSVREVLTTGLFDEDYPLSRATKAQRARVTRLLARFGLAGIERRRFLSLSYGQRRLVMVARAFARPAPAVLLDEVFNGLDARMRRRLMAALERPGLHATWVASAHRECDLPRNLTHLLRLEAGRILERRALRPQERSTQLRHAASRISRAQSLARPAACAEGNVVEPCLRVAHADVYRDYRPVLRDLNWTIEAGEHWAILGANGAGKSTLLRLIYGDLHPALGGLIERRGQAPGTPIELWKRRVGFVSPELQAEHAHAGTLEEVVVSGRHASVGLNAPPTAAERRLARQWLRFFGIDALRARRTREVSYGQMRLALLARAMIAVPELLLLDEPCTGLDPVMRTRLLAFLESLARSGTQIVMAAHHREDLIPSISHVLRISRDGRVRVVARRRAAQSGQAR